MLSYPRSLLFGMLSAPRLILSLARVSLSLLVLKELFFVARIVVAVAVFVSVEQASMIVLDLVELQLVTILRTDQPRNELKPKYKYATSSLFHFRYTRVINTK